ncbi:MAG: hypothetical protein QNJ17_13300 [Desulfocapsaceae bacterium]|nr:hypothetical protein [Desulfocapsaceae bacterium]
MDARAEHINDFLYELHRQTDGNIENQASMHEVGEHIGLAKTAAAALAEELMLNDLVELKTLAGEIGITQAGLDMLAQSGRIQQTLGQVQRLSGEEVLTDDDRSILHSLVGDIQKVIATSELEYPRLEEMIVDLKTMEVQLLSKRPKTTIVQAILESLSVSLKTLHRSEILVKYGNIFKG